MITRHNNSVQNYFNLKKSDYFQKIIRELYQREKEYKKTVFKAQDGQDADQIVYDSTYNTSQFTGVFMREPSSKYICF